MHTAYRIWKEIFPPNSTYHSTTAFCYHLDLCLHEVPDGTSEVTGTVTKRLIIKFKLCQGSNKADLLHKLSLDKGNIDFPEEVSLLNSRFVISFESMKLRVNPNSLFLFYPNRNQPI